MSLNLSLLSMSKMDGTFKKVSKKQKNEQKISKNPIQKVIIIMAFIYLEVINKIKAYIEQCTQLVLQRIFSAQMMITQATYILGSQVYTSQSIKINQQIQYLIQILRNDKIQLDQQWYQSQMNLLLTYKVLIIFVLRISPKTIYIFQSAIKINLMMYQRSIFQSLYETKHLPKFQRE
ncbi:hypothetical protein ABPG73_008316 [Tetrahymena malaccensis]